ncbi:hypothetical protein OHS70_04545 [Streptomyces sp. NBC_00390]|uniref:hypothetical protein n=1 Tax=Streptomyces sp. NBC_00390 TaxID=2975736 RepID=UPI002E1AE8BD
MNPRQQPIRRALSAPLCIQSAWLAAGPPPPRLTPLLDRYPGKTLIDDCVRFAALVACGAEQELLPTVQS